MSKVLYEKRNRIAYVTINRPEARNAMTGPMTAALAEQLASAEIDAAVKCIVLTGAGQGFCEPLEARRLLSTIAWTNRGTSTNDTAEGMEPTTTSHGERKTK